jgi:PepSY-associated TM region
VTAQGDLPDSPMDRDWRRAVCVHGQRDWKRSRLAQRTRLCSDTRPSQVLSWLAYLHFGRIGGIGILCSIRSGLCDWATKAVWALFGLAPAAMFVTGAVMWGNRVVRKRRSAPLTNLRQAAARAAEPRGRDRPSVVPGAGPASPRFAVQPGEGSSTLGTCFSVTALLPCGTRP